MNTILANKLDCDQSASSGLSDFLVGKALKLKYVSFNEASSSGVESLEALQLVLQEVITLLTDNLRAGFLNVRDIINL